MTHIAVLDDDPSTLGTIDELAIERGWTVAASSDPVDFFASVEERRPDVLVVDVSPHVPPPPRNILDELQENPATRQVPLVISSFDRYALLDAQALLGSRLHCVLVKPFDAHDFLRCIEDAILLTAGESGTAGANLYPTVS